MVFVRQVIFAFPAHPATPAACALSSVDFVTRSSATAAQATLSFHSHASLRRRCFVLKDMAVLPASVFHLASHVLGSSKYLLPSRFRLPGWVLGRGCSLMVLRFLLIGNQFSKCLGRLCLLLVVELVVEPVETLSKYSCQSLSRMQ